MSSDQPQEGTTEPDFDSDEWNTITDLKVSGGRIVIPSRPRDRYGIEPGDVLDVLVLPDSDDKESVFVDDAPIGDQTRVLLPPNVVEVNDLEGETVDIRFRKTDKTYDP